MTRQPVINVSSSVDGSPQVLLCAHPTLCTRRCKKSTQYRLRPPFLSLITAAPNISLLKSSICIFPFNASSNPTEIIGPHMQIKNLRLGREEISFKSMERSQTRELERR